jgi:hypothetical protein
VELRFSWHAGEVGGRSLTDEGEARRVGIALIRPPSAATFSRTREKEEDVRFSREREKLAGAA